VVIYVLNVTILSLLLRLLFNDARKRGLLEAGVPEEISAAQETGNWVIAVFLASIPVAFVAPGLAPYVWLLAAVVPRAMRVRRNRRAAAG